MQQSNGLALVEEEDQEVEHANDGKDEMQALRAKIRSMQEEKRERDDYQKRLQRKITKLTSSLADVVEEEEGLRRKQDHERMKKANEQTSYKREMQARASNQENRIREYLSDVLYTKPPASKGKEYELDTVKVTNKRYQHPLAFRLDEGTTVMKLKNNACKYWNVNPDKFILKTMANNKCSDEIRVKDCFKQGELAQLRLEEKSMETAKPSEEELKAIMPKGKGRKLRRRDPRYNAEGIEKLQKHIDSYATQLKKMGGIYFLLKLRETKPSEHCSKIKLRDIIIYTVLAVLSIWVYSSRRPGARDFWFGKGIQDHFDMEMPRPIIEVDQFTLKVPSFPQVKTQHDLWDWMETSLPAIIWNDRHFSLNSYNLMVGYMSIRTKSVLRPYPPWRDCGENKVFTEHIGGACYAQSASGADEETADFPTLREYWSTVTQQDAADPQRIRGEADPGVFVSAESNFDLYNVGSISGLVDTYDAGGYSVQYKMDAPNITKARAHYAADLAMLKQVGWISLATRVVIISFTAYNFDYDMWLASDFMFEIPPSGAVFGFSRVQPFKPRLDETRAELAETSIDIARIIIAIYILVFVGMSERRHKIKYHKAGAWYHISLNGITDYGIAVCIWVVVLWRQIGFRGPVVGELLSQADSKFRSFTNLAHAYNTIFCIEGLMMVFLSLRVLSFLRLNHTVYLLWNTLGKALSSFGFFTLMFIPAIFGFLITLHGTYGSYVDQYSTMSLTFAQFYRIVQGDVDGAALLTVDVVWGVTFLLFFYIVVTFLLMNIFATIIVDAYYIVQVTTGGPGEKWNWSRYYRWAVPGLLVNLIQAVVPGQGHYTEST